ncbi:MAG: heavy metal translocating P-type ATPase, partial [Hyphomicrobiaceae bacterium]
SAAIALPTVAYAGMPFFKSAFHALSKRRLNMDVPISLGVLLATGMSLYQTSAGDSGQVYFDAAVTLLFFLLLGRFLDLRMRARAHGVAANLIGLQARTANILQQDGSTRTVSARALRPGMTVLVAAGERIPVDGRVTSGAGEIDEAMITGETLPRAVSTGDEVFAGSINLNAGLAIGATATDANTLLSEIGRLMLAAEQGRGRYVRLADRAAAIYAPAVHVLGLLTVIAWLLLGAEWQAALTAGIATLIVTCPCALALAVPAVQVAASSRLFADGILIKAADGLERLAEIDTVVFDKTGTLTLTTPRFRNMIDGNDDDLIRAASLAAPSRHPYARAVVAAARQRGLTFTLIEDVVETLGCGISGTMAGSRLRLGSAIWCGLDSKDQTAALWLCKPDEPAVGFVFDETLRPDAEQVIDELSATGYGVEVLSGDRKTAVSKIADTLSVTRWSGQQSPADKIARIGALHSTGAKVLMVGDGLNDAPALTAAHASISPATAADISQTTADTIFQGENLAAVTKAIAVAKAARRMAFQNFGVAIAYNAVFVPMAMAGIITPLLAAVAMSASSIGVTANALRLHALRLRI